MVMADFSFGRDDEAATYRAQLAAIVDSSDDVIVSKTLDGVILTWNRAAERLFGWTSEEAVGKHITLIIPDNRRSEEDCSTRNTARGRSSTLPMRSIANCRQACRAGTDCSPILSA